MAPRSDHAALYHGDIGNVPAGAVAVIFAASRTADDAAGYAAAADHMERLAATQPGYIGFHAVRDAAGDGIAISLWRDRASALAWRDHPDHVRIRDLGRARWYRHYQLLVTQVLHGYDWQASDDR